MDWRSVWRILRKDNAAMASAGLIVLIILVALLAPNLAPHDPYAQNLASNLDPPGRTYLLGTDFQGRDILSRVIFGTRVSLSVALMAVTLGMTTGTTLGIVSGYCGGWVDELLMRMVDILLSFPYFLMALLIVAILGPSLRNAMIAIGIAIMPQNARLIRGCILSVRERDFILAARTIGSGGLRIMFRHLLPNTMGPLSVFVTLKIPTAILSEAALSFLGLGAQPPTASWGVMASQGREFLLVAPWMVVFPGLAIVMTAMAFNLLGDGLTIALDPRFRGMQRREI